MNYRVQRKNLELFKKLKSKGYKTSLILKGNKIEYVTLEINKKKILLSYHQYNNFDMICDVGELYKDNSVWCTYGFKKYPNNIIVSEYINSLDIEFDDTYIEDLKEYEMVFNKYLNDNGYIEKKEYTKSFCLLS